MTVGLSEFAVTKLTPSKAPNFASLKMTDKFLRQDTSSFLHKDTANYTWTIKNLNAILEHSGAEPLNLRSDVFPIGNNGEHQPQFYAVLKETSETEEGDKKQCFLTPDFHIQSSWEPCHGEVKGELTIKNSIGIRVRHPFKRDSIKMRFPDGKIVIQCKIHWLVECKPKRSKLGSSGPLPIIAASPSSSLNLDFEKLLESGHFSDVKVTCSGTIFKCHKNILSARSPVFAAMFQNDMQESSLSKVEIEGLEPEVLKQMLRFIYSGTCALEETMVKDLLVAADRYDIKNLKEHCEIKLAQGLTLKTALELLSLTEKISAPHLEEKTIEFCHSMKSELIKDLDAKATFSLAMRTQKEDQGQKVKRFPFLNFWK